MKEKEKPSHTGHRERIKNKFAKNGLDGFMEHETLELLLTYSIPRKDTKPIAWELIKKFGSLSGVLDASPQELMEVKGVGKETALFLKVVRGVYKKYAFSKLKKADIIRTPEDVANYCRASLAEHKDEVFEVIYLTVRNTVIGTEVLSVGAIDRASISPRKVVEGALKAKAVGIVLVHNHPSGDPSPSMEDISFTKEVAQAARILGIMVHDHIIVVRGGYYSMRAKSQI
ncbi:DNA repair protein RadC [Elusimicrobium minutum Pei191]|uniref:DNA repair protein RadC n=1 Tax=Elusimicrobium minutum (strain Pei191) TaxID=445932 RepID=B2KEG6_ELUMP|nr:DNA repair protein RadC [Elusimicrobium minutum]ACC98912.1 DNA repair protein RadC [Elusimicrobium minutum Pei191]